MMKARKMPAFSYARQNECSIMKIVLIENCVEHSANFIIYKGDGDLSLQVIIGLCKHKEAAALKIEPPLQNGRADMSAIRRLFPFAVVR